MTSKWPERCTTCNQPFSWFNLSICSNSFHCCRDCQWEAGRVVVPCVRHVKPAHATCYRCRTEVPYATTRHYAVTITLGSKDPDYRECLDHFACSRRIRLKRHPGMALPVETPAQAAARRATMHRAGGDVVCSCGHPYRSHPADEHYDFLNVLCNGDRVKL